MSNTIGQQIARSVLPFAFSKHSLTRQEFINMVANPIDEQLKEVTQNHVKMGYMRRFIAGEGIVLNGLVYRRDINADSFLKALESL